MDTFANIPEQAVSGDFSIRNKIKSLLGRDSQVGMALIMVVIDSISILISMAFAVTIVNRLSLHQDLKITDLALLIVIFLAMFATWGLYSATNTTPDKELRNLTISSTTTSISLIAFNLWLGHDIKYDSIVFILVWGFSLALLPLGRGFARKIGMRVGIWGEPVAIFGYDNLGRSIARFLEKNPQFGLRPVIAIDDSQEADGVGEVIPVLSTNQWFQDPDPNIYKLIRTAILVSSEIPETMGESTEWIQNLGFSRVVTVPGDSHARNGGLKTVDLGGILALEERNDGRVVRDNLCIRTMDMVLILLSIPFLIPLFLLIGICIKLDSRGSVFYRQTRIGKGGGKFKVLKFRTMVSNADEMLSQYLDDNPAFKEEWELTQKLKEDPRITRVGKALRKLSLDELPQLWNVVKGEMSLVGPRPIVADEIEKYGNKFQFYAQVSPGITGMWQVSGRNDISYKDRLRLDQYYVRNRSIWLNIYLLARTFTVVVRGSGAY